MIAYDLRCAKGHRFEGWFDDGRAFDHQNENRLIVCPICEDTTISKVPSPFAIRTSSGNAFKTVSEKAAMLELGQQVAKFVENNFENVGADFATEALKMHYGVTEPRNIRGVSTPQEEETLISEGIRFLKFPIPDKDSGSDPEPS